MLNNYLFLRHFNNALLIIIIRQSLNLRIIYTNLMKKTLKGLLLLSILSFFNACLAPEDIRLEAPEKTELVQQLYTQRAAELQPFIDKSCEQNYNRMVSKATDSLVNVYLDSLNH